MRPFALVSSAVFVAAAAAAFAPSARADGPEVVAPAAEKGVEFEPGTPAFADVLAKAKASGKPAFIDFSTDWCGWCKKLEKDTFSQASVAEVMKGFINVHIDAEKGEGIALAERYDVHSFPTLLVVNASGDEIDRIHGYKEPDAFTAEAKRILDGEGTIPSLAKKWKASPDDFDTGRTLAEKLTYTRPADAADIFAKLLENSKAKDRETAAELRLERLGAFHRMKQSDAAMTEAEVLLKDFADTPSASKVVARASWAFVEGDMRRALAFLDAAAVLATTAGDRMQIEEMTIAVHEHAIAAALKREAGIAGNEPMELNRIAWTCFEKKMNVKEAIGWATTAVEKSKRNPAVLDTLANLLWLSGAGDEAVKVETEAAEAEKADKAMKKDFEANVAKWRAELAARAAAAASKKENGKDEDGEDDEDDDK